MKVMFKLGKNTVLNGFSDHFKNLFEHAIFSNSKTKELPFLHSRFNGIVLPPFVTPEQMNFYSTFQTRPGDVFLITYPKAGTIWLVEIVRAIAKVDYSENTKDKLFGGLGPLFELRNHEQLDTLPSPRYMFTHLPMSLMPYSNESNVKYIYLARNPRDLVVSYFHFMSSIPIFDFQGKWEEFLELFMKGNLPWGSYFDHVLEWWNRKDQKNVLFLKYEDLKKDLRGQTKIIAEFLDVHLSEQEVEAVVEKCTFQAMKKKPDQAIKELAKFFKKGSHLRKGIVGDWENHFSNEQLEKFDKLYESQMNGTGLRFEYKIPVGSSSN